MGNRQAKEIKEYEYVVEHGDGSLEEWNGKPVIVKASSKGAAAKIVGARLGGGDWDVRRAGDEPRIAAINLYADAHYKIGMIDRQIAELREERDKLMGKVDSARHDAYQLPNDDAEF